jgi:3-methyladenine DNA glycosylase AlkD
MNANDRSAANAYLQALKSTFQQHRHPEKAAGQKAYMKNHFDFFGLQSVERRSLQKAFLRKPLLPGKEELDFVLKQLWQMPQREFQYFGLDLLAKYLNQIEEQDIQLLEWLVIHQSWWDTVDAIASKAMGKYFLDFPAQHGFYVEKWIESQNLWLQRSAILFQLNYKNKLDTQLLAHIIHSLMPSDEFFINKAIGWILRQYARVNQEWVIDFTKTTALHPLSRREALKHIKA